MDCSMMAFLFARGSFDGGRPPRHGSHGDDDYKQVLIEEERAIAFFVESCFEIIVQVAAT